MMKRTVHAHHYDNCEWVIPSGPDGPPDRIILAIGDSITQGVPFVPIGHTYPEILSKMIGIPITNLGVGGLTVAEMEMGFGSDVAEHHPYIVLIMGGVNDIEYGRSPEEIIDDLSSIYAMASSEGITVVMCTLLPSSLDAGSEEDRIRINGWIRGQVCEGRLLADVDIEMCDHDRKDRLAPEYDSGDGAHPNAEGMRSIAKTVQIALFRPIKFPGVEAVGKSA